MCVDECASLCQHVASNNSETLIEMCYQFNNPHHADPHIQLSLFPVIWYVVRLINLQVIEVICLYLHDLYSLNWSDLHSRPTLTNSSDLAAEILLAIDTFFPPSVTDCLGPTDSTPSSSSSHREGKPDSNMRGPALLSALHQETRRQSVRELPDITRKHR